MFDLSDGTDIVTALLAATSFVGVVYALRYRAVMGEYYLLFWVAMFTVTFTVWASRAAHALVEPRSAIVPFLFVAWTWATIFVLTLLIVTVRRKRRI